MNNKNRTLDDLSSLYNATVNFKNLAPWEWMRDSDLFAVVNPYNNEVSYCTILGMAREVFALNVYLGEKGFKGFLEIVHGHHNKKNFRELIDSQRCLMASFEDRAVLDQADLKAIKELKLNFRGNNE